MKPGKQRQSVYTNDRKGRIEMLIMQYGFDPTNRGGYANNGHFLRLGASDREGFRHKITITSGNPLPVVTYFQKNLYASTYLTPGRKRYRT